MRVFHKLSSALGAVGAARLGRDLLQRRMAVSGRGGNTSRRRASARGEDPVSHDAEIVEGFLKTAFGAEYHLRGRSTASENTTCPCGCSRTAAGPTARRNWRRSSPTSRKRVQHLDIAMAEKKEDANVSVKLVRDRDLYLAPSRPITAMSGRARSGARSIRMPVRLPQEREVRDRAFRCDPYHRQRRFRFPGLRL